ncbi:N-acetylmuramoyl-L-alanine amidase CwlD [Peribacillus acanthi]|uniref:N-acetylmuramoyl-L-alanine amidase CwlD n=1 Tax=Peribacillus acanthi TaxID=2171554 RepID=UPI000D3E31F6|nr:N-acetylmuramoyl-L-alanine amidase CwlD [Peribacillus acanthi]
MVRKFKFTSIAIGIIVLFLIVTFQFMDDDSWDSWNLPLTGKVIILDAGHGGPDGGADAAGVVEKEIALSVTEKLRDYLQQQGALVIMTRETDTDLAGDTQGIRNRKSKDLRKRVELINESEADLFISLHLNSFPSSRWSGAQTFYSLRYEENERVAKFIQRELRENLGNTTREARPIGNVYLMKYAKKPGVLVEVGFLSNAVERKNLTNKVYQNQIAASIYKGVMRYFTEEKYVHTEDKGSTVFTLPIDND